MKQPTTLFSCLFVVAIALALAWGCSKDSNPVNNSSNSTIPSVAKAWRGTATRADGSTFALTTAIIQNGEKLSQTCFWSSNSTIKATATYTGTITSSRQLSLQGSKCHNHPEASIWSLDNQTATLSANGDTISGTFAAQAASSTNRGTFVLVKQSATETYPSVATNWAGFYNEGGTQPYKDTAYVVQALDMLGGYHFVKVPGRTPSGTVTATWVGKITQSREVVLREDYNDDQGSPLLTYTGKLSAAWDTLSLSFTGSFGGNGTLVLYSR